MKKSKSIASNDGIKEPSKKNVVSTIVEQTVKHKKLQKKSKAHNSENLTPADIKIKEKKTKASSAEKEKNKKLKNIVSKVEGANSNLESDEKSSSLISSTQTEAGKKRRRQDHSSSTCPLPTKKQKTDTLDKKGTNSEIISKKKKQKKKVKKPQDATSSEDAVKSDIARNSSIEYLRQWKRERSNWNFQKVRQVWLLKNMYDEEKLPEEDFELLLEYLEGLSGIARKTTIEKAEKIMKDLDSTDKNTEENTEQVFSESQMERVRQVLQLLH